MKALRTSKIQMLTPPDNIDASFTKGFLNGDLNHGGDSFVRDEDGNLFFIDKCGTLAIRATGLDARGARCYKTTYYRPYLLLKFVLHCLRHVVFLNEYRANL